jgi:hypothetical protein
MHLMPYNLAVYSVIKQTKRDCSEASVYYNFFLHVCQQSLEVLLLIYTN